MPFLFMIEKGKHYCEYCGQEMTNFKYGFLGVHKYFCNCKDAKLF